MNRPTIDPALLSRVQQLLARRDAQPPPEGHTRPELKITAQADGQPAELLIYDEISWWGIMAVDVAAALSTLSGPLHVRINSPGGDVFDGVTIYNLLLDYPGEVTVTVDGLAASAASFIAMAGDRIVMNRASQMMIHDASGGCRGSAADMKAMAALLDVLSGTIAGLYAARAGGEAAEWREKMLVDGGFGTWFTAEEAVEAGLADEMVPNAGQDDGEGQAQAQRRELADARFPYGTTDGQGPWRLAAMAPPTATEPPPFAPTADQVPAPTLPRLPVAAQTPHPHAEPTPVPAPAVPPPARAAQDGQHQPDLWADLTAPLITPTSSEDEWDRLREALL